MRFADIPGHEGLKKTFASIADSGRIAHAMLLYENEGCGALPLALAYVQYLNCPNRKDGDSCGECPSCRQISKMIHPDTYFIFPVNTSKKVSSSKPVSESFLGLWRELAAANPYFLESELYSHIGIEGKAGTIAIAEAKFIIEKLSMTSVADGYKTVILWLPEKMRTETSNKLLKIVEEPPEKTVFIFITHDTSKVLPTIFSRCQSFRVPPLGKEEISDALTGIFGKDRQEADRQAALSGGSLGVALEAMGEREEYEEFMQIFKDLITGIVSKNLMSVIDVSDQLSAIDSREKRKAFCIFASGCLRKIFLSKQGLQELTCIPEEEAGFYSEVAPKLSNSFCSNSLSILDNSVMLLERNVNHKMVFCDLAGQMFLNL